MGEIKYFQKKERVEPVKTRALTIRDLEWSEEKWILFANIIAVIKNGWISKGELIKLIDFLMNSYEINLEEIKNYKIEIMEYEEFLRKNRIEKRNNIDIKKLVLDIKKTAKQKGFGKCVILRIIRVAKIWQQMPILKRIK